MSGISQEEDELSQVPIFAYAESQINKAKATFGEACKILQREASKLHDEQETFNRMSKKIAESTQNSETVKLDVGGHHFTTTRQTLTKDPDSMFAAMFSGRFPLKDSQSPISIDRDGTYFSFILNYLRDGKLSLPEGATFLEQIEDEAKFYQIQGIIDELSKPRSAKSSVQGVTALAARSFAESKILTRELDKMLSGMLPYKTGEWRLLFRASRDGFTAESFHSKCDDKGPTVTVVKSGNFVFGGFTEAAWRSPRVRMEVVESQQAFLFSLVNPRGLGPVRIPADENESGCVIACKKSLGPSFGRDYWSDKYLHIANNPHSSRSSYCRLREKFSCPQGEKGDLFFTGAKDFVVDDYEVFEFY